ncbi:ABC-2 type transport system permease protein [Pedobacter africanus]|uniref:ABC-2 type transport system permease protein n=1 Tax=Pedobacter africanus TaxID=151894 RepID=A0ACC6KS26_9SPHI|nr:ABC transporter permease subunit [Pedobacter africanus]MDR6782016.1 ABC-2 type transport system permease protein [Pedobacter africanus]
MKSQSLSRPFSVMLHKEMADHIRSWRFIVLIGLIILTFVASMYVSLGNIRSALSNANDPDRTYLYLKLLTTTDNSIPPFHVFLSFLAPLLGISLGFDAINAEQNTGTLTRLMAQPIYRDNILLAKFVSALMMVGALFLVLALLMIGGGLLLTGVRMEPQEFLRILGLIVITIVYVGFWLSLSIVLSVRFRQAATSALTAIGLWLFFTVFYQIVVNLIIRSFLPDPAFLSQDQILRYNELILDILRIAPNQLYTDASTTMLMPSVRSLGPMTMEQMAGAIPAPLPFRESLMIVWPQLSGLIGVTVACFALAYYLFMRREIRS